MNCIEENIQNIRQKIAQAAHASCRKPEDITLLAASKTMNADTVRIAAPLVDAIGENRVQEMIAKNEQNAYAGCPLHFIGALQTNKVKQVVGACVLIHSVDSEHLAQAIEGQAARLGIRQDILIEVNIGRETNKSGIDPADLEAFISACANFPHIRVRGLMAVPPALPSGQATPYFQQMKALFDKLANQPGYGADVNILSMGMSHDYAEAIICGSTLVRIGTGIFGQRNISI